MQRTVDVRSISCTTPERSTALRLGASSLLDLEPQQPLPPRREALGEACLARSFQPSDGGGSGCCSDSTSSQFHKTEEFQNRC